MILGLFNRIALFDIKRDMATILFLKLGQDYHQASFSSHISFVQMKLDGIFQDLEHLYDFQTIGYDGHIVFHNEATILHRQVFISINIPCIFGEDFFINE